MAVIDIDQAYSAYQSDPTPDNLSQVVKTLQPTINYALAQHQVSDDPLVRSKATLFTVDAIKKYDPTRGANLATHVSSQLRQLSRTVRQSRAPVRIPERIQLDAFRLAQAQQAFADEHGRDPDTVELADFASIPVKRIEKIRKFQVAIPSEEAMGETEQAQTDWDSEALDAIFHDSDHTDRRILEMKTGYGGHPVLTPKEIAVALRLSPTQLTRRSMRLGKRIQEYAAALEKV